MYYISAGQNAGQNVPDFPFPIRPPGSREVKSKQMGIKQRMLGGSPDRDGNLSVYFGI